MATTVEKALSLLSHFSEMRTEIGLSELARLSGYDKAAVQRMLSSLRAQGFVEQCLSTRRYRLGLAFQRFARLRELTFPVSEAIQNTLEQLAKQVGETCHYSAMCGQKLATLNVAESPRFTRVHVDIGGELPVDRTASGFCVLAFGAVEHRTAYLDKPSTSERLCSQSDPADLQTIIDQTLRRGFSISPGLFEADVFSAAAPVFGTDGFAVGAISVASLAARIDITNVMSIAPQVLTAAREATKSLGGFAPPSYLPTEITEQAA